MELSEFLVFFFKILTISGQKRQIWEHTEFFCQFLHGPNEFASFCVGFSSGKASSFLKSPKSQNLGFWKKCPFYFLYWKIQQFDQFLVLSGRGLNYEVSTENKLKLINFAWMIVAQIFKVHHQFGLYWPEIVKLLKKSIK